MSGRLQQRPTNAAKLNFFLLFQKKKKQKLIGFPYPSFAFNVYDIIIIQ
jgi:hypothetical protein